MTIIGINGSPRKNWSTAVTHISFRTIQRSSWSICTQLRRRRDVRRCFQMNAGKHSSSAAGSLQKHNDDNAFEGH